MSFFSHTKICFSCQEKLPLYEFHKDRTTSDGYASSCKVCRNAKRKKVETVPYNIKVTKSGKVTATKVKITREPDYQAVQDTLTALSRHLGSHFSLSVSQDGSCRLQVHGNPAKCFRAKSVTELLELVFA